MSDTELRDYANGMYARVNDLWRRRGDEIFGGRCGFAILSGPPAANPPMLVIGSNPGFGAQDNEPHVETHWPAASYIPHAQWDLARKLRRIFATGNDLGLLEGALQTNFQLFKSASVSRPGRYRWLDLPAPLRADLDAFCATELAGYIALAAPRRILVLGLDTFDTHAVDREVHLRDRSNRRRLLVGGRVFGVPAWGVIHPSGAQVAEADWRRVVAHIG